MDTKGTIKGSLFSYSGCPALTHAALTVSGMCSGRSGLNGEFVPQGLTASGRPWYKKANGATLYWDINCQGYDFEYNYWIFDGQEPSVTATSNLDGDTSCGNLGYIVSTSVLPPSGTNTWYIDCGGSFTNVEVTITECVATSSPSDDGSDGHFYCVNGGTAVGTIGSCTCTNCDTGFIGVSCEKSFSQIIVSGMCSDKVDYDGTYSPVALTASGKPWYKNENGNALYFDPS